MMEVLLFFGLIVSILVFFHSLYFNKRPSLRRVNFYHDKIDDNLSDYKIIHISDFHNSYHGKNQKKLVALIEENPPNIIVITGDLIDRRRTNIDIAIEFLESIVQLASVYYVTGNHEKGTPKEYGKLEKNMIDMGVVMMDDRRISLENKGSKINLLGLADPRKYIGKFNDKNFDEKAEMQGSLDRLCQDIDEASLTILLVHRPEKIDLYANYPLDLVFTGHAHGGQIRFLGLAGYAPDQGFFPKYSKGIYRKKKTQMIVSPGLANSRFPLRVFNKPEILEVSLKNKR